MDNWGQDLNLQPFNYHFTACATKWATAAWTRTLLYEYSYIMGNCSKGRTLYLWQVGNAFTKHNNTTFTHKVSCDWLIFANRVGRVRFPWEDATQWVIEHPDNSHIRSSGRGIMFHPHAAFYHLVRWAWNLNIFKDANSKYWWWFTNVNRVFAILIRLLLEKQKLLFLLPLVAGQRGQNRGEACSVSQCVFHTICQVDRRQKRMTDNTVTTALLQN